jgi:tRNA-dependent cyclodipeptide synthase
MEIKKYLGATKEDIDSKKFNIWIGISLGNKYFTKENIKKYIFWALEHTKEDVLIMIDDRLYAIKLESLDKYNKFRSFKVASRYGDAKEKEIREIISTLSEEERKKIKIVRFKDVISTKYYEYRLELLQKEYKENKKFREKIAEIIRAIYGEPHNLNEERIDNLANYALKEIPIYLNGAYYGDSKSEQKYYECNIYPGLSKIDYFIFDLREGISFPELTKRLNIHNRTIILEGYPS